MGTSSAVARAQIDALRHRVPVLYGILCINIAALCYTHHDSNPFWQVVLIPAAFVLLVAIRSVVWVRMRPGRMTDRQVRRERQSTAYLGAVIGILVLFWALTLQHSPSLPVDSSAMTERGHSVFFVGITFISCIFLLMHHRFAAILVGLTVVIPLVCYLFSAHRIVESAIGLNVVLVAGAMLYVAIDFSKHFDQSVVAAADLLRLSAQNARLAGLDALTSLPNRRQFFTELAAASAGAAPFALIVCDLDGFKMVNDVFGHQAGDTVLREIADRLRANAPDGCSLARLGGDEFTCLLVGEACRNALPIAEKLLASCREPIALDAFTAQVGATAGICLSSSVPDGQADLIYERADYALFKAKKSGRGRIETFNGLHDRSMRRESTIAHRLRSADLDREMSPVYQPIVAAGTGDIRAFEALVRWSNPELGPIGPQEFIPIAERTELILKITQWMFQAALAQAATWPDHIVLKVNLSVRDLMSSQQTERLLAELRASRVIPRRVTFEITETILAESIEQIKANVDRLRAAGCKIAIDDFGVGYSSLSYIHTFAPDVIKIDRCFIDQIAASETTRRVVRTMVELARNVGALCVAEGVETAAQAKILAELGCDELQGFFFSRGVSAERSVELARGTRIERDERAALPVPAG